jgi:predicted nucleotidyltransferase
MEARSEVIELLAAKVGRAWPNVTAARERSAEMLARLRGLLQGQDLEDTSVVVFGSFARGEYTSGSDIDWTLLIDGRADEAHFTCAQAITKQLQEAGIQRESPFGIFDNVSFSHPILHQIGGHDDTNRNTTQRILLLLESIAIGRTAAHERLLNLVLSRYVTDDRGLLFGSKRNPRVPRFLLNDIVRYWRTITIDFQNKQRNKRDGWALRNVKLRMSRKLLFASGMLSCFSLALFGERERWSTGEGESARVDPERVVSYLRERMKLAPLEQIAEALLRPKVSQETAAAVMDSYDAFLGVIADDEKRNHLVNLPLEKLGDDPLFKEASRTIAPRFQEGLDRLFFEEDDDIALLVKRFGVF